MAPEQWFELADKPAASLPRVIAIGGEERVFVDEAIAAVRASVLSGGMADFNHDKVSGKDRRAQDVLPLANTLPVMSAMRLVEVKDAEGWNNEGDAAELQSYLAAANPSCVLLLVFGAMDWRDRACKLLDKTDGCVGIRFEHPKERDMKQLAQRRAKRHKLNLGPGAAEMLAATVGADLTLMERALEKLVLAVPSAQVSEADVAAHISDTHAEDAFAFVRAVSLGDRAQASAAVAALQAARDEPIRLVGLLAWQLRLVLRAKDILDQGGNPGQALNLYGDRAQPVLAAARAFTVMEHRQRLIHLTELDEALKSSRAPPWVTFGHTIDLLTEPKRRPAS